jgi:hypothetical protein
MQWQIKVIDWSITAIRLVVAGSGDAIQRERSSLER